MTVKRPTVATILFVAAFLAAILSPAGPLAADARAADPAAGEATTAALTQIPGPTITATFPSGPPRPPDISSTAAFMIDADTGEYLFSHNANARLPMASTTKIMTAVLVLESLDLDKEVRVSVSAVSTIGSKSGLVAGETLTVRQLLEALLVVSGNDASIALATAVSGSVTAFAEKMNAKADELELTNTHFVNPCGLQNQRHFSSAKDMAFLAQYALRNPVFASIVDTIDLVLPPIPPVPPSTKETPRVFDNQNELLKQLDWINGVKTGSTPYAKYCLVSSGSTEGVSVIATLLGAATDSIRWKESMSLLLYGLALYPRTVLVNKGEVVAEIDVGDPLGRGITLVADRPLVVRLREADTVTSTVNYNSTPILPVRIGDALGTVEFTLEGDSLGSVTLLAAQSLEKPSIGTILDHLRSQGPQPDELSGWTIRQGAATAYESGSGHG